MSGTDGFMEFMLPAVIASAIIAVAALKLYERHLKSSLRMAVNKTEFARGEQVMVKVEVPASTRRLEVGIRAEETYETTGKHGQLYKETAYEEKKPLSGSVSGKVVHTFDIPKSAPPSIGIYTGGLMDGVTNVGLRWYVFANADIPNALDKHGIVQLKVK